MHRFIAGVTLVCTLSISLAGKDRIPTPESVIGFAPGAEHKLFNTGDEPLVLLCCCSPAYSHDDTVLTEPEG